MISRLPHYCPVCAYHDWNLDGLVEMTWEYLDLLRIYTKPKVPGNALPRQPRAAAPVVFHGTLVLAAWCCSWLVHCHLMASSCAMVHCSRRVPCSRGGSADAQWLDRCRLHLAWRVWCCSTACLPGLLSNRRHLQLCSAHTQHWG